MYFRSSSFNQWDMCPHSYFIQYVLGRREPSGKKAILGSIVHKALECLARQKLAWQDGKPSFVDEETGKKFNAKKFTPEDGVKFSFDYYAKRETHHKWTPADLRQCTGWTHDAMELNGGMWNPLNRTVVSPEQFFDFAIDEPWARYSFQLPDGKKLEGQLALKGTVDLVTDAGDGVIEYLDWKTGRRLDWATGQEKTWAKLRDDPQLRIYHYALSRLYPAAKQILMTIVFVRDGGAFSLPFDRDDLAKTEAMLRGRFETIRDTVRPRLNKTWRCTKLCHFGKNDWEGGGKTICQHLADEVVTLGVDRVMKKYGDPAAVGSYGEGGGRTAK